MCLIMQPRQTVLTAAGSIGQASGDLLRQIGENETDERFQVNSSLLMMFFCVLVFLSLKCASVLGCADELG